MDVPEMAKTFVIGTNVPYEYLPCKTCTILPVQELLLWVCIPVSRTNVLILHAYSSESSVKEKPPGWTEIRSGGFCGGTGNRLWVHVSGANRVILLANAQCPGQCRCRFERDIQFQQMHIADLAAFINHIMAIRGFRQCLYLL